jgi:hypothetical protein
VCKACHHQGQRTLQAIIDAGQGDRPLKDLRFRCTSCGSRRTDAVMMSRHALGVQPWKPDGDADSTGVAGHLRGQRPWGVGR